MDRVCGRRVPALREADEDESVTLFTFYDYAAESAAWRDALEGAYRHPDFHQQQWRSTGTE
jgi:hypothetical protein